MATTKKMTVAKKATPKATKEINLTPAEDLKLNEGIKAQTEDVKAEVSVTFISPIHNLSIRVKQPVYNQNNRLIDKGLIAEFNDGRYETSDPEVIEKLKDCPLYGKDYSTLSV